MKKRSIAKQVLRGAIVGTALAALVSPVAYLKIYHPKYPTNLARIYYNLTDDFSGSLFEKLIQDDFKIDYEGTLDEKVTTHLYSDLIKIRQTNPALLTHLKKIIIIPESVYYSELVYPYLDYVGLADPSGTIELMEGYSIDNLAHELAHIKYFNEPRESRNKFYDFFKWDEKIIKTADGTLWEGGTAEPRNGFLRPYGATNEHECIATYVEKFYEEIVDYSFWRRLDTNKFDYKQVLNFLHDENFITQEQYSSAVAELKQ
ncbi:hypothetical protein HZA97_04990 [Candidatus Woesearchaeota archaeon]|nr:hypothetical protein [Candidatus Woesearchaeota archaeon]